MWFKNLYLFRLEQDLQQNQEDFQEALTQHPFKPCQATQRESLGWEAPLGKEAEELVHSIAGYHLLTLGRQQRLLPASVIREELEARIEKIRDEEDRKVSGKEKKSLREAIEFELLPQAFTRTTRMDAWIDIKDQWLLVNTSSATRAEELTGLLRKSLGSLPVELPAADKPLAATMTGWLREGVLPPPFAFGEECQFSAGQDDQGIASFRKYDLLCDEVTRHAEAGQMLSRLELVWDEKIRFVLGDDFQIRKLRFLDVMEEQLQDHDPQSHAEQLDIEFAIMSGEVSNLLKDLMRVLQ